MLGMFKVSNRVHDGLVFMTILAKYYDTDKVVPISVLEKLGDISAGYMEEIIVSLRKNGLVKGVRGQGGGYRLGKPPAKIRVNDVIGALGDVISLGLHEQGGRCPFGEKCYSRGFFKNLEGAVKNTLLKYTLKELIK